MVDDAELKHWRDAGHVARRTLEYMRERITEGRTWAEVIEEAEAFIRRKGGRPAFPATIAVDHMAAHYTTDHANRPPKTWKREMVFEVGDLVKLDVGVQINGCIGDNALTIEVGGSKNHTEQIRISEEARDASVEAMTPGTPWHEVGAAAGQVATDAGFRPIRNLCGHQLKPNNLHAGISVPSFACGKAHDGFKGTVPSEGFFAIEPFNTTGEQGLIENISPASSSNIFRVTGQVNVRRALSKKALKPLGATLARYMEERYGTLPFAQRWGYELLRKTFPQEEETSLQSKWNALVKKLISIRFLETYPALSCVDGGSIGQFEHTIFVHEGGPEILTVE